LSAVVAMMSLWFVARLPDLRLHESPPTVAATATEL
jgi:hypothetical protein